MNATIKLAGVRFSIKGKDNPDGTPSLKNIEVYCLDKHKDIYPMLSDSAVFLLKKDLAKRLDIDDLTDIDSSELD